MAKYRCIQRLTTDNQKTIHEVGEIVELSDTDAQVALKLKAVEPVTDAPDVKALKQEVATLQNEINQTEQTGDPK